MDAGTVQIAIDAMGGDHGPEEAVAGAAMLSLQAKHIQTILVGDAAIIETILERTRHNAERISVFHAPEVIGMGESAQLAVASKPQSSLLVAARLVRSGEAQAMVTAGNTGAAVLACAQTFQLLPGVRRAALASVYPTERQHGFGGDPFSLLLDVGATVEASSDDLIAFAVMGTAYARLIGRNISPSVALLSNGTEPNKGPPSVVEAHARLLTHPSLNFIGNVEGIDIPRGRADVVVCDGFTGNVVLKMLEGVSETVVGLAHYAYKERLLWRAGLAMLSGGLQRLKFLTDWQQYGGAPVLGFDQVCIKAHGRSNARAIANAGRVAARAVATGLIEAITEGLSPPPRRLRAAQGRP